LEYQGKGRILFKLVVVFHPKKVKLMCVFHCYCDLTGTYKVKRPRTLVMASSVRDERRSINRCWSSYFQIACLGLGILVELERICSGGSGKDPSIRSERI
jgi:hypothetical protein